MCDIAWLQPVEVKAMLKGCGFLHCPCQLTGLKACRAACGPRMTGTVRQGCWQWLASGSAEVEPAAQPAQPLPSFCRPDRDKVLVLDVREDDYYGKLSCTGVACVAHLAERRSPPPPHPTPPPRSLWAVGLASGALGHVCQRDPLTACRSAESALMAATIVPAGGHIKGCIHMPVQEFGR